MDDIFNSTERSVNMLRSSLIGGLCHLAQLIPVFVGRTIFLRVLSEKYLGITGLFTNLLLVLSLADLGIATAITYRFYEPISRKDVQQVGRLMNFFKWVYTAIMLVILAVGLALTPAIRYLVKDAADVPTDVNIYFIYLLFLAETISTYIFVYKQTLLSVDQRNDLVSIFQTVVVYAATILKTVLLIITKSYTVYLVCGICTTISVNYGLSLWVTKRYAPVFAVKEDLPKEEKKQIYSDTQACLLHKVGSTVLSGTDNLVLTKVIGLAATGLYSNYSIITQYLLAVIAKLFDNYVSSIGNAKIKLETGEYYDIYRKLRFLDWFVTSIATVCLFVLVNDFIGIWLGTQFVLDRFTVGCLCMQFWLAVGRLTNGAYINASGLFVRDKARPIIEAVINLVISVILAKLIGIAGVFLGTVISELVTTCWREPYLLFKHEFKRKAADYWGEFVSFVLVTAAFCLVSVWLKQTLDIVVDSWLGWLLEAIVTAVVTAILYIALYHRKPGLKFALEKIMEVPQKFLHR